MPAQIALLACFLFAFPTAAYAYIDPGTATLLVQTAVVGFVFLGVLAKAYFQRIKRFLKGFSRQTGRADLK
jgi:hypothetical protein